jgi:hypothetical protein
MLKLKDGTKTYNWYVSNPSIIMETSTSDYVFSENKGEKAL